MLSRLWSDLVHALKPYIPGEQPRMADLVKLNTNENPLGPSPLALEAIRAAAGDALRLYPDPHATALRQALADRCQKDGLRLLLAPPSLCTDNAGMVAFAAAQRFATGHTSPLEQEVDPNWRIDA